ncbi:MAG: aldehyde dehydrogenase family protein, partial [Actinobacteria bacterium]|nr:aldehyde dehydrogenase family protein [Actinomycetota bacterium]
MFARVGARYCRPSLHLGILARAINPLGVICLHRSQAMREQVEIHLHHLGVVGDLLAGSRPVVVVARAKVAAERWANLSFRARNVVLRDWASTLTRDMKEAAELIHRETGKPLSDATLEVALAIEHIAWAGKF